MVLLHFKELAFKEAKRLTADLAGGRMGTVKSLPQSHNVAQFFYLLIW